MDNKLIPDIKKVDKNKQLNSFGEKQYYIDRQHKDCKGSIKYRLKAQTRAIINPGVSNPQLKNKDIS
jgi:hypothetical protein